jgi:hypothetical protein
MNSFNENPPSLNYSQQPISSDTSSYTNIIIIIIIVLTMIMVLYFINKFYFSKTELGKKIKFYSNQFIENINKFFFNKNTNDDISNKENANKLNNDINNNSNDISITKVPESSLSEKYKGWCYIGEDRGFRSCIYKSSEDKCMSGDIFPTKDICINPSLRY